MIIIGLYLVIWGKRKDYKSPSIEEQDKEIAADQGVDMNSQSNESLEVE